MTRKVDVRLPGKGNSNSHGARPVHLLIPMIKWIRTSRLSIMNSLSRTLASSERFPASFQESSQSRALGSPRSSAARGAGKHVEAHDLQSLDALSAALPGVGLCYQ